MKHLKVKLKYTIPVVCLFYDKTRRSGNNANDRYFTESHVLFSVAVIKTNSFKTVRHERCTFIPFQSNKTDLTFLLLILFLEQVS